MNLIIEKAPISAPIWDSYIDGEYESSALNYHFNGETSTKLTPQHLNEWAVLSEKIEEPEIVGKFNCNEHYLKTLELVLNSTVETQNNIVFFQNNILPIVNKNSFLDVGPGDGSITLKVANYFENLTAIDPNVCILDNLEKCLPRFINFKKINKSIQQIQLESNAYDLVILSHIIYYIEPYLRLSLIKSIYNSLKKNGILVIILGGDELGKAKLIEHFGGQNLKIDQLALDCCDKFGPNNISLYASNEAFITSSMTAMFHIAAFMLADANISTTKDNLINYIQNNFQLSEHHFVMTTRQKYIVIKK